MGKPTLGIGLVMGGGVSLGAFSGGALAEVVRRLAAATAEYEVRIDALSGASAGAMTLGLMLRSLADPANTSPEQAAARVQEAQEAAWVGMGLDQLLPREDHGAASLLARAAVDEVARRHLSWTEGARPAPQMLGPRVLFNVTLLNYDGIPIQARPGELGGADPDAGLVDGLSTTLFRDHRVFGLEFGDAPSPPGLDPRWLQRGRQDLETRACWSEMAATCVAAGAFPLAFEPVGLVRYRHEYGELWAHNGLPKDTASYPFTYGDGGTFDNEPLKQVFALIRALDEKDPPDRRIVLFIDSTVSGAPKVQTLDMNRPADAEDPPSPRTAGERFFSNAVRLGQVVLGQARYRDLLEADKVNRRLQWRDRLRERLVALGPALEGGGFRSLLEEVLETKSALSLAGSHPDAAARADREMARVRAEADPGLADGAAALLALLDQVADLRARRVVTVAAITPGTLKLAGDFLSNFGGFFQRQYREFDFASGRFAAQESLDRPVEALAPLRWPAIPPLPAPKPPREDPGPWSPENEEAVHRLAERITWLAVDLLREGDQRLLAAVVKCFKGRVADMLRRRPDEGGLGWHPLRVRVKDRHGRWFCLQGAGGARQLGPFSSVYEAPVYTLVSWPGGRAAGPHVHGEGHLRVHPDRSPGAAVSVGLPSRLREMCQTPATLVTVEVDFEKAKATLTSQTWPEVLSDRL